MRRQRLLQLANAQFGTKLNVTQVGLLFAGDQPQQRGLAGAVAAHHANPLTGLDGETGLAQDSAVAEVQGYVVKAK